MRKNLKKILPLLVIVISLIFLCPFNTEADSGWDGSYDSGSSSSDWGGSSSWDSSSSSWDDSSSSSSNSSSSGNPAQTMSFILFIVISYLLINYSLSYKNNNSSYNNSNTNKNSVIPYSDEEIKEILPDFDREKFLEQAFEIYKNIQEAWMDFDDDTLRKMTTDELYNAYNVQLTVLKAKKQKNIMKDFELLDKEIVGMEHNENSISLKVRMIIECLDYVVDKNEKIVRGSKNKVRYDYEMTFIKGLGKESKCPSCGAELEANSNKCPYCRSTIVSKAHDFVLSKKQVISQKRF